MARDLCLSAINSCFNSSTPRGDDAPTPEVRGEEQMSGEDWLVV